LSLSSTIRASSPSQGAADGAGGGLARFDIVAEDAAGLGHAPDLDHREAEPRLERVVQGRVDRGAQAEFDLVQFFLRHRRLLEQDRRDDAHVMDRGRLRVSTRSRHQLLGWNRSAEIRQPADSVIAIRLITPEFMWKTGKGLNSRSSPKVKLSRPPRARYQLPEVRK
jgi:hypothetical protein